MSYTRHPRGEHGEALGHDAEGDINFLSLIDGPEAALWRCEAASRCLDD
jgi:hypothetical protein